MPNPLNLPTTPSYNPINNTYRDSSGNLSSRPASNVPTGTNTDITLGTTPTSGGGSSGGGGGHHNRNVPVSQPTSNQPTDSLGQPISAPVQSTPTPVVSRVLPNQGGSIYESKVVTNPTEQKRIINNLLNNPNNINVSSYYNRYLKNYDSNLNAIAIPTSGGRGTSIITPLTPVQQNQIDMNTGIAKDLFGDTKSGNILTIDSNQFRRNIKQVQSSNIKLDELNKELDELSKGNVKDNLWTGSDESFKNYQDKFNEYQTEQSKLDNTQQTIGVGLGSQKQVPITNFKYMAASNPISQVTSVIPVIGETLSETFRNIGSNVGRAITPSNPELTINERTSNLSLGYQTRGTSFSSGNEYFAPTTTITTPKKVIPKDYYKEQNAKILGGTGYFVGRTAPYSNPLGVWIYRAEQSGKLASEIEFARGDVKKGAVNYFKTYPYEAIGLVAGEVIIGGSKVVSKAVTKLKLNKYGKYVTPAREMRVFETGQITNKYKDLNFKRPILTTEVTDESILGGEVTGKKALKTKGTTEITEIYPTNDLTGISKEKRWVGTMRLDKEGIDTKVMKTFTGKVSLRDGNFKQTVDYGKYKKEININKEGEGSIKLFDKEGNIKFYQKIKPNKEPIKFIEKTKSAGINAEAQSNKAGLTIISEGRGKIVMKDGKRVVDLFGNPINPDLTATNIKFVGGTDYAASTTESGKYAQVQADTYFNSEVIEANARSGQAYYKGNRGKFNVQQKTGQKIERGINQDVDTVTAMKGKTEELKIIKTSPRTKTEIAEGSSTKIIQFIDPKGKATKESINPVFKKMSKSIEKALKEKAEPSIKKIKELKSKEVKLNTEPAYPKMVGGEGGQKAKSMFEFNPQLDNVENVVYVPETSSYLKGASPTKVDLPQGFSPVESMPSSLDFMGKFKSGGKITEPNIKIDTSSPQTLNMKSNFVLDNKTNTNLDNKSNIKLDTSSSSKLDTDSAFKLNVNQGEGMGSSSRDNQAQNSNQAQDVTQVFKQVEETKQTQRQEPRQLTKTETKMGEGYRIKTKVKVFPPISLLGKLSKAVDTTPDIFKVFARSKGKDILISKETSLEGAKTKLQSSLTKTLKASGYISLGKEKIKVSKLGNLGSNFGTSKRESFRLIELKNKRIKRGTSEQSEIQVFKRGKKSKFF